MAYIAKPALLLLLLLGLIALMVRKNHDSVSFSQEVGSWDTLTLAANDVFFPKDGNPGNAALERAKINDPGDQREKFYCIPKWQRSADTLVWPIKVKTGGELMVIPYMSVTADQQGSEIEIIVGQQKKTVVLQSTGKATVFADQASVSFEIPSAGQYLIQLTIKQKKGSSDAGIGNVRDLKLTGPLAKNTRSTVNHHSKSIHTGSAGTLDAKNLSWFIGESSVAVPYVSAGGQTKNAFCDYLCISLRNAAGIAVVS